MEDAELLDGSLACAENYDRFIAAADARRHDEAIATVRFSKGPFEPGSQPFSLR